MSVVSNGLCTGPGPFHPEPYCPEAGSANFPFEGSVVEISCLAGHELSGNAWILLCTSTAIDKAEVSRVGVFWPNSTWENRRQMGWPGLLFPQ
jgi:hypothetical protein